MWFFLHFSQARLNTTPLYHVVRSCCLLGTGLLFASGKVAPGKRGGCVLLEEYRAIANASTGLSATVRFLISVGLRLVLGEHVGARPNCQYPLGDTGNFGPNLLICHGRKTPLLGIDNDGHQPMLVCWLMWQTSRSTRAVAAIRYALAARSAGTGNRGRNWFAYLDVQV